MRFDFFFFLNIDKANDKAHSLRVGVFAFKSNPPTASLPFSGYAVSASSVSVLLEAREEFPNYE